MRVHSASPAGSPAGPFPDPGLTDVGPSNPFYDEIAWMIDSGLSTVAPGGGFRPAPRKPRCEEEPFPAV